MKQVDASFYVRLALYVTTLALSISSLAGDQWGEIGFTLGKMSSGSSLESSTTSIGIKPKSISLGFGKLDDSVLIRVPRITALQDVKIDPPDWHKTIYELMIAGTSLQGTGFLLNLCDLSQNNDYFVLSGYAITFIGSVLVIAAASEWIDRNCDFKKDIEKVLGPALKASGSSINCSSKWGADVALASGILGAAASIVGLSLELRRRMKRSDRPRQPFDTSTMIATNQEDDGIQ